MLDKLLSFTHDTLIPHANTVICEKYESYCTGADTGIVTKADGSPAGNADRQAEEILRKLIEERYPTHGLWGEEFGAVRTDAPWVWVLDPLDGTREFLAKNPDGFGILIGVLHHGRAVIGAISDPVGGRRWLASVDDMATTPVNGKRLAGSIIACTNPEGMFKQPEDKIFFDRIRTQAKKIQTGLNCLGFAKVADGATDAAVEQGLGLHDIAALLPVLQRAGKAAIDLNGKDYYTRTFSLGGEGEKFGIIAAESAALAHEILSIKKESL